jgi:hypothetical protein
VNGKPTGTARCHPEFISGSFYSSLQLMTLISNAPTNQGCLLAPKKCNGIGYSMHCKCEGKSRNKFRMTVLAVLLASGVA